MQIRSTSFGLWANDPLYIHRVLNLERASAVKEHLEIGASVEFVIEKFIPQERGYCAKGLVIGFYPGKNEGNLNDDLRRTILEFIGEEKEKINSG